MPVVTLAGATTVGWAAPTTTVAVVVRKVAGSSLAAALMV